MASVGGQLSGFQTRPRKIRFSPKVCKRPENERVGVTRRHLINHQQETPTLVSFRTRQVTVALFTYSCVNWPRRARRTWQNSPTCPSREQSGPRPVRLFPGDEHEKESQSVCFFLKSPLRKADGNVCGRAPCGSGSAVEENWLTELLVQPEGRHLSVDSGYSSKTSSGYPVGTSGVGVYEAL